MILRRLELGLGVSGSEDKDDSEVVVGDWERVAVVCAICERVDERVDAEADAGAGG